MKGQRTARNVAAGAAVGVVAVAAAVQNLAVIEPEADGEGRKGD